MLYYDKILKSEGIDEPRTGLDISKECDICHFYFFRNRNFLYQPYVCNECHDISLRAITLADIKISLSKVSNTELLATRHTMSVIIFLNRTVQLINLDLFK